MGYQSYTQNKHGNFLFFLILTFGQYLLLAQGSYVRRVTPHYGSLGGETRLTIYGGGFIADLFDDPIQVYLEEPESGAEVPCPVHKDGTTETQIMCYTTGNMTEANYYVKVVVDGEVVPDASLCYGDPYGWNCHYKPQRANTPTIDTLFPRSGTPGTLVTLNGTIFTDLFGSNRATATNGRPEQIKRAYVGGQECALQNSNGTFYGISLDNEDSDYGSLTCETTGTSVGFVNVSLIIGSPFGRSQPGTGQMRVSYNDRIYQFQSYTDITLISPSAGSPMGGMTLTIFGNYFDDLPPYEAPRVFIDDLECEITNLVADQYMEITVPAEPQGSSTRSVRSSSGNNLHPGNRGVTFEYWTSTSKSMSDIDGVMLLSSSDPGYNSGWLDETYHYDNDDMDNYVSKMTTFFTPPHDGEYEFQLLADDGAKLFLNSEEIVRSTQFWTSSDRRTLSKDTRYLLEVLHYENSGDSFVHVGVKHYNTDFLNSWIDLAVQEQQRIRVTSQSVNEVQELEFLNFESTVPVNEQQTVTIETNGEFRFGLHNVFTETLTMDADETTVAEAFNALPVFGTEESVSVNRSDNNFTFTFNTNRGNMPPIQVRQVGNVSYMNYTVIEDIQGMPDMDTLSLTLDGIVSRPFSVSTLTAPELQSVVQSMFEARCPPVFESQSFQTYYQSYEINDGRFYGTRVKNTEPFCDRYSLKNPSSIYKRLDDDAGIFLSQSPRFCMAYKGILQDYIWMRYSYKDATDSMTYTRMDAYPHRFLRDSDEKSERWYYECVSLENVALTYRHHDSHFRLEELIVRQGTAADVFVDSVFFGSQNTTSESEAYLRRLPPAMPNGAIIDEASVVAASSGSRKYIITLKPFDCGHDFPLFNLTNGRVSRGEVESPSSSATIIQENGVTGSLEVRRTGYGSPPVTGSIEVKFGSGTKSELDISLDEEGLKNELETLRGIGSLQVEKNGSCANFDIKVIFLTLAGDQPEMRVKDNKLVGIEAQATISTIEDGYLFYSTLAGDILKTVHEQPQVRAYINAVPVKCSGNCGFLWDSAISSIVNGVTPNAGTLALGTEIDISGTGFNTVPSDNEVKIGGVECVVTAATDTSITCSVGNCPVGEHVVEVLVANKGYASHDNGDVMFTCIADINDISPTSSGIGGGVTLTISGYGLRQDAVVTINSEECYDSVITSSNITCTVPTMTAAGTYDIIVSQGSTSLSYSSFEYDSASTAVVSSVSPTSLSVDGGEITLVGSGFGSSQGVVVIGDVLATVQSWNDTEIVVAADSLDPGTHTIKAMTPGGWAVIGAQQRTVSSYSLPNVMVDLWVTNVTPLAGSMQGGTKLTITGSGFGTNSTLVQVSVGNIGCVVETLTDTQIICKIEQARTYHYVSNRRADNAYGFNITQLDIIVGDTVIWNMDTPDYIYDMTHAVWQVANASSNTLVPGGFSSGSPVRNGMFEHTFYKAGEYFIVGSTRIINYRGHITVSDPEPSLVGISVHRSGKEAIYNIVGTSNPAETPTCQPIRTGCQEATPTPEDTSKPYFLKSTCCTPFLNSVNRNNGTTKTEFILAGAGFSTDNSQNEVLIGSSNCNPTESSETEIKCTIEIADEEPDILVLLPITMQVNNVGYALPNATSIQDLSVAILPHILGITPSIGSKEGGAIITITGFGFGSSALVTIDGYLCVVVSSSYTQITCETPSSDTEGEKNVMVTVMSYPADCETITHICSYAYASIYTPIISSITPATVSSTSTLTITGESLGNDIASLEVDIGGVAATVTSAADTSVEATVDNIPAGSNTVVVRVNPHGKASGPTLTVHGSAVIDSITPSSGSIHGETTLTIAGNGFVNGQTSVTLDGSECTILSTTLSEVTCITTSHSAGPVTVAVTSNGETYPNDTYSYLTSSTPTVTSVSPTSALSGESITIFGSNFDGATPVVLLGDVECDVTSSTGSQIDCIVGNHAAGEVNVYVHAEGKGASNEDITFEYNITVTGINPTIGGTGGGQIVTLSGAGFLGDETVAICGNPCQKVTVTSTAYQCKTQATSARTCDVILTTSSAVTKTSPTTYTFDASLTPSISGVSPSRVGTGGGTIITITGSGFEISSRRKRTTAAGITVIIDGSECDVISVTNTQITCATSSHEGSIQTAVELCNEHGCTVAGEVFTYIDMWSSRFTWGGASPPEAGELVVIPAGQTLLLDTNTPVLKFLLIQGGSLIFDEQDIELNAEIIMITDGGLLQVGTEDSPFQHKGIITMHGHHRSKELPVYGTKVLAVRNGTLDLHGIEVALTWTRLAVTASAGSDTLELENPVEWNVGDEIVIASTGNHHSQSENEKKSILAISSDKTTLTLDSALEATHWGEEETFDGTLVEFRAEVGRLSRNVVVRGSTDPQWQDVVEACPDGFNTGEFATQTCFQGRFGEELGSNQFGAHVMMHSPSKDTQEVIARISHIEVTHAGQAFRLGRYPIHFHLNGDMSRSYVRGCGIHKTFNRAINIHGSHNLLIENNVVYNVMGGALFFEDGIETGNIMQYNLAVFVRESSSLLNDDVTPASFWVTNPNNIIRHNAAAGGTHFGYWYRMHDHPEGPSFTEDVCCKKIPLGEFYNNSAHSFGWYGLWVFPDYFPMQDSCHGTQVEPAVFSGLTAWNNDKGAETVNTGALQMEGFILVQNRLAGFDVKMIRDVPRFTDDSPMVRDSLIAACTTVIPDSTQGCTATGVLLPHGSGFVVSGVTFANFNTVGSYALSWTTIDGTCTFMCGGFTIHTQDLTFSNSLNMVNYHWEWEGILLDRDGSLTGEPNGTLLPTSGTLPHDCEPFDPQFVGGILASVCPPQYKFRRFAFNNINPESLEGMRAVFTNQFGTSLIGMFKKRLTHPFGWMIALLSNENYTLEFENAEQVSNISYSGTFYDLEPEDYILMSMPFKQLPDRLSLDGGNTVYDPVANLDPDTMRNADWTWDAENNQATYAVRSPWWESGVISNNNPDQSVAFTSYKCYYEDCIPPPDLDTIPPALSRSLDFLNWDDSALWNETGDGYITSDATRTSSYGEPQEYDNVHILYDDWVVVDGTTTIKLGTLLLEGTLELMDTPNAAYELSADHIIIMGGRLVVGWPNDPFENAMATIVLRGNHSSPYFPIRNGPTLGTKGIGVYGGLDLFGRDVGVTWTKLASTAAAGSNQIILAEQVSWSIGNEIVVGTTSFDAWETETFAITDVASDNVTLTLNDTLQYRHIAHSETINGMALELGAVVGLLTRNIKVVGEDYPDLYDESFGARVLVGRTILDGQTYTGYARLSNVEFYHTGQEGWTEEYDPRFSVAYVATGTVSNVKPSMITKCAFHNGFNSAIGAFGIGSLNITDNVVHHTVGHGIRTSSDNTSVLNNMVALSIWKGAYQDRLEPFNFHWHAGIEAMGARGLVLQDNVVSGSERYGFHVPYLECDEPDPSAWYSNNIGQSNLIGVGIIPEDDVGVSGNCAMLTGVSAWKNHDFGIYYQNSKSVVFDDIWAVDNRQGIFTQVFSPPSLSHVKEDKTVEIRNSLIVGQTASFDCTLDSSPSNNNFGLSSLARPAMAPSGGKIGVVFPTFASGPNGVPSKKFNGIMNYNAIGGLMMLQGMTFAHYGSSNCQDDVAVATSATNDDGQHPIEVSGTTLVDVAEEFKIVYHRPNVGKINSADCVDMDCDGLKKALLKDLDGTFLGEVGAVIPQSEFEWGGDPRRGLGDYRIPKEMVTRLDGTRIAYNIMMPNKGIYRGDNCTYMTSWQAYGCFSDNYEMLIIESMDPDTETRRLSPVALLSEGYIDLINGPQDHGWCSGYTCRKRLSTFMALVATGHDYLLHFTSVTPRHMRYYLLNTEQDQGIKLSVWYARPNRLDVFVNDTFVASTNAYSQNGQYLYSRPVGSEFDPVLADPTGTNFMDRSSGLISVIIKGTSKIDIKAKEVIVVSFDLPDMTVSEFFGENIIENLAAFFDLPPGKVRVVDVRSVTARRRKRSTGVVVDVEIGDEPSETLNGTVDDSLEQDTLLVLVSDIVNECQTGNIATSLNITGGTCEYVEAPTSSADEDLVVYTAQTVQELVLTEEPVANYEGVPLLIQPKIQAVTTTGEYLSELGTAEYPWQLTASLRAGTGHPNAFLEGTLTINASAGWFNFTDLSISHMGTDYILDFNMTYPTVAENITLASDPLSVARRPIKPHMVSVTSEELVQNMQFSVTLELRDETTNEVISNVAWRSHTWEARIDFLGSPVHANLSSTSSVTFDAVSGQAFFPDVVITGLGIYYLHFNVLSAPGEYNISVSQKVTVIRASHVGMVPEEVSEVKLKFDEELSQVLPTEEKKYEFEQMIMEDFANAWTDVKLSSSSVREGSIIMTFVISGTLADVNTTVYSLCDSISNNTQYSFNGYTLTLSPYMTINNSTFYGVSCGAIESEDSADDGLHLGIVVAIVIVALVVVGVFVALLVWRFLIKPKLQAHTVGTTGPHNNHYDSSNMGDTLFKDETFTSMKFNMFGDKACSPTTDFTGGETKHPLSSRLTRGRVVPSPTPSFMLDLEAVNRDSSAKNMQAPMRAFEHEHPNQLAHPQHPDFHMKQKEKPKWVF